MFWGDVDVLECVGVFLCPRDKLGIFFCLEGKNVWVVGEEMLENDAMLFIMTLFWKWCDDLDLDGDAMDNDLGDVV